MGKQTILETIKEWLAGICWHLFLQLNNLTEEKYIKQIIDQESRLVGNRVMPKIAEALQTALDNWKRCYVAYGREVMREELQETLDLLSEDKDWQKVNQILSNFSA